MSDSRDCDSRVKNSRRETDLIFGEIADGILREISRPQVEPSLVIKLSIATRGTRLSVRPFTSKPQSEMLRRRLVEPWESDVMSEMQIHTIARQMMEKHGLTAIAQAAHNAQACESKGDADEAREWRHIEDAMKLMRGPHQ